MDAGTDEEEEEMGSGSNTAGASNDEQSSAGHTEAEDTEEEGGGTDDEQHQHHNQSQLDYTGTGSDGEHDDTHDAPYAEVDESVESASDSDDDASAGGQRDAVQVAVRCRPMLPAEQLTAPGGSTMSSGSRLAASVAATAAANAAGRICVHVQGNNTVLLARSRLFTFDYAFAPRATQEDVYKTCVAGMVKDIIKGYHATIFASGKHTHNVHMGIFSDHRSHDNISLIKSHILSRAFSHSFVIHLQIWTNR